MNIEYLLAELEKKRIPTQKVVYQICSKVKQILMQQSNICSIRAPVTVCGSIRGNFLDLLKIFRQGGPLPDTSYLFLGNYINKSIQSVETMLYLLLLKIKYPQKLTLIRGNHQTRNMTKVYGFQQEIRIKYGNQNVWRYFMNVFDYLPISAQIENQILCVHSGLSPSITILDQIKEIDRVKEIGLSGPACDFVWSEPSQTTKQWIWDQQRGAGYLFGQIIVNQFNYLNNLKLIVRGHSFETEGYKEWFSKKNFISIWSAPNYAYICGNPACILQINENLQHSYHLFNQDPSNVFKTTRMRQNHIPYFL